MSPSIKALADTVAHYRAHNDSQSEREGTGPRDRALTALHQARAHLRASSQARLPNHAQLFELRASVIALAAAVDELLNK